MNKWLTQMRHDPVSKSKRRANHDTHLTTRDTHLVCSLMYEEKHAVASQTMVTYTSAMIHAVAP